MRNAFPAVLASAIASSFASSLHAQVPVNDACASALAIAGLGSFPFDNTTATTGSEGQSEPACLAGGSTAVDADIWFNWTATSTGTATVSLCGLSAHNSKLAVYDGSGGCPPVSGSALACNDDSCGTQSQVSFPAITASTYFIQLGSSPGTAGATGMFSISMGAPGVTLQGGSDFWVTPGGTCTFQSFSATPLPAGLFGPGSDPFTGTVFFIGVPLTGSGLPAGADTVVRRPIAAVLPTCPASTTVPIEIVALSLTSYQPITVTFNAGTGSSTYAVSAALSSTQVQTQGLMTINRTHANGGDFSSTLPVVPRMVFTRTSGTLGLPSFTLDPAPTVTLTAPAIVTAIPPHWVENDMGLGIPTSPGGFVDHDSNTGTGQVPYPPSANFIPGVFEDGADCVNPGRAPQRELTSEAAVLARHCIFPTSPPGVDGPFCFCQPPNPTLCANYGDDGHGCANSVNPAGALLNYTGTPSVLGDTVTITMSGMPATTTALLLQGSSTVIGLFGDGLLCVTGLRRIRTVVAVGGTASVGFPTLMIHIPGLIPAVGGTFYYQGYYRNAAPGFCPPALFNTTNAYALTWTP